MKRLAFITLGGFILRLLGLFNTHLGGDFATHWKIAGGIAHGAAFPLFGPSASVNSSFHLGPFYYYLLSIPYFLGRGDYHVAIIFFSLINSISILFVYFICKEWLGESQSLKVSALFSLSSYIVNIQNFPWNPYVLPLLITASFFFIQKIKQGQYNYFFALSFTFGLSIQFHATALFLLPVYLLMLPLRKIAWTTYILAIVVFALSIAPWIYADATTNFSQTKAAAIILTSHKTENCSIANYVVNHGHGEYCFSQIRNTLFIGRMFDISLFDSTNIFLVVITLLGIAASLVFMKLPQKRLFILWLVIPWLLFMFYSSNIYLHYFLIFIPMPFILAVIILEKIKNIGKYGAVLSNLIFIFLILYNILEFLLSLKIIKT